MNDTSAEIPILQRTVGEIAANLPGATGVFREYRLDFCCGGDVPLATAAERRGIDHEPLVARLSALEAGDDGEAELVEPAELIEYIMRRHHGAHREQLPELIRLALKVERVHRDHSAVPAGLTDALECLRTGLEHMNRQEEVAFPVLQQADPEAPLSAMAELRREHQRLGTCLHRIEEVTGGFRLPDGACRSWQALYTGTTRLVNDVMEHVHLEANVLLPRLEPAEGPA